MINGLRQFPTSLKRGEIEHELRVSGSINGWHESLFRSYQVLQKVKDLLRMDTPPSVVLEIINDAYDGEKQ